RDEDRLLGNRALVDEAGCRAPAVPAVAVGPGAAVAAGRPADLCAGRAGSLIAEPDLEGGDVAHIEGCDDHAAVAGCRVRAVGRGSRTAREQDGHDVDPARQLDQVVAGMVLEAHGARLPE